MGQISVLILIIAFIIRTIRNTLYQVFLWQIKEYRFDRMIAHLQTWQGKRMALGLVSLAKFALIGGYLLRLPVLGLVVFLYVLEAIRDLKGLWVKNWRAPVWTAKATVIISLGILGSLGGFWPAFVETSAGKGDWGFWALISDKLLTPIVATLVLIFSLPTKLQKEMVTKQAKTIIFKHPSLITVGITGSYGKTSTKEFLSQILGRKFKVLKTEGSQNTAIGVAKTIIERLKDQEIFVCEMGAYKIGEIGQICQICKPQIGIITGINEQHLDLFGSLTKTMQAKYELIESLPKNGLAVFNGLNEKSKEMEKSAKTISQIGQIRLIGKDIKATNIRVMPGKIEFEVVVKNGKQKMSAHLLGRQNIENILAAIVVANHLGMSLEEIAKAVEKLESPERTMRLVLGALVDDTFNANPDGVLAAIEYMKAYKGKKILVLTPMIELGKKAGEVHQKVGKLAGEVCDLIILTNKNYYEDFMRGFGGNEGIEGRVWVEWGEKAMEKIKNLLDEDGVAVFEGKESARILDAIAFIRPPLNV